MYWKEGGTGSQCYFHCSGLNICESDWPIGFLLKIWALPLEVAQVMGRVTMTQLACFDSPFQHRPGTDRSHLTLRSPRDQETWMNKSLGFLSQWGRTQRGGLPTGYWNDSFYTPWNTAAVFGTASDIWHAKQDFSLPICTWKTAAWSELVLSEQLKRTGVVLFYLLKDNKKIKCWMGLQKFTVLYHGHKGLLYRRFPPLFSVPTVALGGLLFLCPLRLISSNF